VDKCRVHATGDRLKIPETAITLIHVERELQFANIGSTPGHPAVGNGRSIQSSDVARICILNTSVDLVRVVRNSGLLVEEPRPFGRAHAHHRPLHVLVVSAAPFAHVALAHRIPDLLGLEQHAVEVEDDRFPQTEW